MREIVDAHHHLWDRTVLPYPWLEGPPFGPSVAGDVGPIAGSYLLDDYRADAAGYRLTASVHVDGGTSDRLGETAWVQALAAAHGLPTAIVAGVQLHEPDAEAVLAKHAAFPAVRGIRHILNWDPDPNLTFVGRPDLMTDPAWLKGYAALARHRMSFDLQVYPWQLGGAADLATKFPMTTMILNHAGMPIHQRDMGLKTWKDGMRRLAARPNTFVKISGLGMVDWGWSVQSIRPLVLETIDIFGADRCMFASNFPVDRLYSSFTDLYAAFEEIVAGVTEAEQHAMFAGNAKRVYRIIRE
jgi:predicted TIM-barrel fold metal-dependent hydrolase